MTTKTPPWLEELSDDWPSETSSFASNTSGRSNKHQISAENPRKPRSLKPKKHRNNRTVLGNRNGNAILFNQGDDDQISHNSGKQLTINDGTVQQKTPRASPTKVRENANIPEWKKRLVHGEMAYGEQKDLFSPVGLENIFQQVNRFKEQTTQLKLEKHKPPTDQKSLIREENFGSTTSQISTRRKSRYIDGQRQNSHLSEPRDQISGIDTTTHDQKIKLPGENDGLPGEKRFISGQTELNEEFSPVFISKQSTVNGRANYAAHGPYKTHIEHKIPSKIDPQNASLRLPDEKPSCDKSQVSMLSEDLSMGTPDIAELGDFVTCKRGSYSAENSFRSRPLSPSPVRQNRSQALSTHRPHHLSTASTEIRDVHVSHKTSESHQKTPPRKYSAQTSNSPLKLFGNHDTFTNHQLLRRMGQLQESREMTLANRNSERILSAGITLSSATELEKGLSALTTGEPSIYDNHTESPTISSNVPIPQASSLKSRLRSRGKCLSDTPTETMKKNQSSTESERSPYSSVAASGSMLETNHIAFSASNPLADCNKFSSTNNPGPAIDVLASDTLSKSSSYQHLRNPCEALIFTEGKRPQSSPTKSPTPKRRRTLLQPETLKQDGKELETQEDKEADHRYQSFLKREGSSVNELDDAYLDGMLQQQSFQDLKYVSDKWQQQEKPIGDFFYQGHKSELEPISEYGEFQATPQKLFAWNPQNAAIDRGNARLHTQADTRKHSLTTQDYIDEAMKIMSWIRNNRPKSGLASLEEAEDEQYDEKAGSEGSMTLSRPPSREGRTKKWRDPNSHKLNSKTNSRLQKYREDDNDNIVLSSLEALRISDPSEKFEASQPSSDTIRITHNNSFIDVETKEDTAKISNAPNALDMHYSDHSDKFSSGRTNVTEGSRRSENVTTFAPDAVAHLIPKEVAGMTFDKEKGIWVRVHSSPKRKSSENRDLSTTESDDDPLEKIPDLVVDEKEYDGAISEQSHHKADLRGLLQKNAQLASKTTPESKNVEINNYPHNGELVLENTLSIISNEPRQYHAAPKLSLKTKPEKCIDVDHEYSMDEGRSGNQKRTLHGRKSIAVSFPTQLLAHVPLLQERRNTWQPSEASAKKNLSRPGLSSNKNDGKGQTVESSLRAKSGKPTSLNSKEISYTDDCTEANKSVKESILQTADRSKGDPKAPIAVKSPSHCQNGAVVTAAGSPRASGDITFYLSELSEFSVNQIDEREVKHYIENKEIVFYQKGPVQPFEVSTGELVRVIQDAEPEEFYWEDIRQLVIDNKKLDTLYNLNDFCYRLQTLSVAQNNLRQLAGAPPSIRQLNVSGNQLSSLTTWAHLTNLQYLDVSGNNIDSLSGFGELIHLRELRADNNQIASLDGILTLDALIKLSLSSNQFSRLDFTSSNL